MSISIKEYFALAGSRFSKEEARAIGPLLHELAIEGRSSSADVVEAARSSNSPIRRFFEWDDARAGHLYRLSQADEMIGSIRVRYTADNREYATRAFRVIVAPKSATNGHAVTVEHKPHTTMATPPASMMKPADHPDSQDKIGTLAADAIRELDEWRLKYSALAAIAGVRDVLIPVLNQIEEFRADFSSADGATLRLSSAFAELVDWERQYKKNVDASKAFGEHIEFMADAITDAIHTLKKSLDLTTLILE